MLTTLSIAGMKSVHAVQAVFTSLGGVDGVERADVSLGKAVIEHDGSVPVDALRDAIAVAGFDVTGVSENRRMLPTLP